MRHTVPVMLLFFLLNSIGTSTQAALKEEKKDDDDMPSMEARGIAHKLYVQFLECACVESPCDDIEVCQKDCCTSCISHGQELMSLFIGFNEMLDKKYPLAMNESIRRHFNDQVLFYFTVNKDQEIGDLNPFKMQRSLHEHARSVMFAVKSYAKRARFDKTLILTKKDFHNLRTMADKAVNIQWELDELQKICSFTYVTLQTDKIRSFNAIFPFRKAPACCLTKIVKSCRSRPIAGGIRLHKAYLQLSGMLYPLQDLSTTLDLLYYFLSDCKKALESLALQGKHSSQEQTKALAVMFEHHFSIPFIVQPFEPELPDDIS